jgi:DNA-binding NarL/FixJ family response regulator
VPSKKSKLFWVNSQKYSGNNPPHMGNHLKREIVKIGLVEDHTLLRNTLAATLNHSAASKFDYAVVLEADHGEEMILQLNNVVPDIMVLDVRMPKMDGVASATWLQAHHPEIKVMALSMFDDDKTIIRMIRAGASAFLPKTVNMAEMFAGLESLKEKGYYNSDSVSVKMMNELRRGSDDTTQPKMFSERERRFLELCASDKTYKQIATEMYLSERTIEGYREAVFEKFHVQSRVGLVLEAIKKGVIKLEGHPGSQQQ